MIFFLIHMNSEDIILKQLKKCSFTQYNLEIP